MWHEDQNYPSISDTSVGSEEIVRMYANVKEKSPTKQLEWLNTILRPKINCGVGLVNCFFRVPLMYQPCCLLPCCQGKLGELTKKQFTKPTPQFILGRSIHSACG